MQRRRRPCLPVAAAIGPAATTHRDLNCARVVLAGGIPGAVRPLSRTDAVVPSQRVPSRPGTSQQVS
jgi:hypothetical protein